MPCGKEVHYADIKIGERRVDSLGAVKWREGSRTRFGEVVVYAYESKELQRWALRGRVPVHDAILPEMYVLPLAKLKPCGKSKNPKWDWRTEADDYKDREFKRALKLSDSLGDKIVPGRLISFGVADGLAWYVVTAVLPCSITVEWRGFQGDNYQHEMLGIGGSFPRKLIEPFLVRARAWAKLPFRETVGA